MEIEQGPVQGHARANRIVLGAIIGVAVAAAFGPSFTLIPLGVVLAIALGSELARRLTGDSRW